MKKEPIIREKCGTTAGYQKHWWEDELYCEPCKLANRQYVNERRKDPESKKKRAAEALKRRQANLEEYRRKEAISQAKRKDKKDTYDKEYRAENREKINRRIAEYRKANPELMKLQRAAEYQRNKEKKKAYREAHKEEMKAWKAEYYLRNIEKITADREANKERTAAWRRANPELSANNVRKRRARKRGVPSEPYTAQDVLDRWGTDCWICGEPIDLDAPRKVGIAGWERGLHLEHSVDLVLQGHDTLDNVKPAHGKCNLTKKKSA
jgi:hypothetical protein